MARAKVCPRHPVDYLVPAVFRYTDRFYRYLFVWNERRDPTTSR